MCRFVGSSLAFPRVTLLSERALAKIRVVCRKANSGEHSERRRLEMTFVRMLRNRHIASDRWFAPSVEKKIIIRKKIAASASFCNVIGVYSWFGKYRTC